jgi:hypothetical protein
MAKRSGKSKTKTKSKGKAKTKSVTKARKAKATRSRSKVRAPQAAPRPASRSDRAAASLSGEPGTARRQVLAPTPRAPLALPVAASKTDPVRPESVRPRSWIERALPRHGAVEAGS